MAFVAWRARSLVALASLVLAACGGGGGGGGSEFVSITAQPQDRTATPGAAVTFSGGASGSPSPTFQWERSADDGVTWTAIAGATSASYTFTVALFDRGTRYRFEARSGAQTAMSSSAKLTVTTVSATFRVGTPWGLAFDTHDGLYAADIFADRIAKYTAAGAPVLSWGSPGTGASQFQFPKYLATDGGDNVYVSDGGNSRIQKFSASGAWIAEWGGHGEPVGATPAPDGKFNGPTGIAVDPAHGWVYVVDSNNSRIQKFDLTGTFLLAWGDFGTGNGQFRFFGAGQGPEGGIAVDAAGDVYVVDNMNWRVQKFSSSGAYLTQWGTQGTGPAQFLYPSGIAVDAPRSLVYVVDNTTNGNLPGNVCKVVKFDLAGIYLASWQVMSLDGTPESGIGVATDSAGRVYVAQGASVGRYDP